MDAFVVANSQAPAISFSSGSALRGAMLPSPPVALTAPPGETFRCALGLPVTGIAGVAAMCTASAAACVVRNQRRKTLVRYARNVALKARGGEALDTRAFNFMQDAISPLTSEVAKNDLDLARYQLLDAYKPLGRCVAIMDEDMHTKYGAELDKYFAAHKINLQKLVFSSGFSESEVGKNTFNAERILVECIGGKERIVDIERIQDVERILARKEPLLLVGHGFIARNPGLAASLQCRNIQNFCINDLEEPRAEKAPESAQVINDQLNLLAEMLAKGFITAEQFEATKARYA